MKHKKLIGLIAGAIILSYGATNYTSHKPGQPGGETERRGLQLGIVQLGFVVEISRIEQQLLLELEQIRAGRPLQHTREELDGLLMQAQEIATKIQSSSQRRQAEQHLTAVRQTIETIKTLSVERVRSIKRTIGRLIRRELNTARMLREGGKALASMRRGAPDVAREIKRVLLSEAARRQQAATATPPSADVAAPGEEEIIHAPDIPPATLGDLNRIMGQLQQELSRLQQEKKLKYTREQLDQMLREARRIASLFGTLVARRLNQINELIAKIGTLSQQIIAEVREKIKEMRGVLTEYSSISARIAAGREINLDGTRRVMERELNRIAQGAPEEAATMRHYIQTILDEIRLLVRQAEEELRQRGDSPDAPGDHE